MLTNTYDIVHYIGHGSFVEQQPELSGWVFADDLLRARDLTQLERAPLLVVANACWSAAHPVTSSDDQPALDVSHKVAPVLADEFLRAGAGHFIGTSWRLPTTCARTFSTSFYEAALGNADNPPVSVGAAILLGRRALWRGRRDAQSTPEIRAAWAAYQHYGDPTDRLVHDSAAWPGPNIGLIGGLG